MKKLEDKIIDKVYRYETKKTLLEMILRVFAVAFFAFGMFIFAQLLFAQLYAQQTLDVLQIFTEDTQIIRDYVGEVVSTLYEETPKPILFILLTFSVLFVIATLTFIFNFEKIKNRFKSLTHYWFHR